ncbi:MAG: hypothetical protein ABI134_12655 [Byssovorax sp.]
MISTLVRSSSILAIVSAGLLALGCGPSTPPAEHAGEHAHGEHGEHGEHAKHEHCEHGEHGKDEHGGHEHGEHGEHPKLTGAMHEFHEVLAPLWHAEKSPERAKKTCEAVATFEKHAAAVDKDAPADAARAAAHHTAAQGLVASVGELKTECAKPEAGRADFEAKFKAMHEAFHKVMESAH